MSNFLVLMPVFLLLVLTDQSGAAQTPGAKINYRCWIYPADGGSTTRGFLVELRDSSVVIALNSKRPRKSDVILKKEIQVQSIRKIDLRKNGQSLELAGLLGGAVFLIAGVSVASADEDDYFQGPGAAIGIGLLSALPVAVIGAAIGSARKSFVFDGDSYKYKYQRELMRRHMKSGLVH